MPESPDQNPVISSEAITAISEVLQEAGLSVTPRVAGEIALRLTGLPDPQNKEEALANIAKADELATRANSQLKHTVHVAREKFNIPYAQIGSVFGVTRQAAWERFAGKVKESTEAE